MKTPSSRFPLIPGIILGALLGAIALALLVSCSDIYRRVVQGNPGWLIEMLGDAICDAFTKPWGAIGALIGGTMAWKRLRSHPESAGNTACSWSIFHPGEAMLAWGLVCLLASFGVYPSVMTWFLALGTLPLASVLLLFGALHARDSEASASEQFGGFGLLFLGVVVLGAVALTGTNLSYRLALPPYNLAHQIPRPTGPLPSFAEWVRFLGGCLIPALLIGAGLASWTDWPSRRRLAWCVIIALFPIGALILHRILVGIGFLSLNA